MSKVVGLYLRQSEDRDGDQLAVSRQRADLLVKCRERGWTSEHGWHQVEYVDNDVSATRGVRKRYREMLTDISEGRVHAVAVWDLDRLHRQPRELEDFIDLANSKNLDLASVSGDHDLATPEGRLFARMKGMVAKHEIEQKAKRQKRAARQRADKGIAWTSRRPFGYTKNGMELDPIESILMAEAYAEVLAGATLGGIAKRWNTAGHTTTMGNPFDGVKVRELLLNPRYAALRVYDGEIVGPAAWPGVVTEDIWRAVDGVLRDPSRRNGPLTNERRYLGTSIYRCGVERCGAGLTGNAANGRPPHYRCEACLGLRRRADNVDRVVELAVVRRLTRDDAVELLRDDSRDDFRELSTELAAKRARLDQLAVDYAAELLTAQQVHKASTILKAKIAELETALTDQNRSEVFAGVVGAADVSTAFEALGLDRKRAIVNALFEITVLPVGRVGRAPFDPRSVRVTPKA